MNPPIENLEPPGLVVPIEALGNPRAKSLAELLRGGHMAFTRLVECRASSAGEGHETIVFEVDVQRPQILVNDIRRTERLAVTFHTSDSSYPELVALRFDFPLVPHLNLRDQEFPRSICLYDRPWHEVRLRWTAPAFIEQVRSWLARTAQGSLHGEDQPLEPFFLGGPDHIVIPHTILNHPETSMEWLDVARLGRESRVVLVARKPGESGPGEGSPDHVATVLECQPVQHGIIRRSPRTLKELNDITRAVGVDVIAVLKERLSRYKESRSAAPFARLILILLFPKSRQEQGTVESTEIKCFFMLQPILEIGIKIGLWKEEAGYTADGDTDKDGSTVPVHILNAHPSFSWKLGATLNDLPLRDRRRLVALGAGALGSQVIINLARAGYGDWTIIDEDILLPHNLARHGLNGYVVGWPKAEALARTINHLADDEAIATPIIGNLLSPGKQDKSVDEALKGANAILDLAASVAVARHLAHYPAPSRRVSLFMNPAGTDLVLLAEDSKRQITLDCLEIQYYRALCQDDRLHNHFTATRQSVRYGQSCRDVSSRLPQALVAAHAGLAAMALRAALMDDPPAVRIWRIDPKELGVEMITRPVYPIRREQFLDWTLILDGWVLQKVSTLRKEKLPNETGGVLIGTYDMQRKIVYVADVLPSPPDSEEWPTLYIRGCEELAAQVGRIREMTAQNLEYIGEWHSHPDGCSTDPSSDDAKVFAWLTEKMNIEGKPPLMLIAGEGETARMFLCMMAETVVMALRPEFTIQRQAAG